MTFSGVPGKNQTKITYEGGDMVIRAAMRKAWMQTFFLLFWLTGWAAGELFALRELFTIGREQGWTIPAVLVAGGFLLVWLTLWTVGGVFALGTVLLRLFGKQVLRVNEMRMAVTKEIFGIRVGRTKEYEAALVSGLSVGPDLLTAAPDKIDTSHTGASWLLTKLPDLLPGILTFTFGGEVIRIEMPDPFEARAVTEQILSQYPIYRDEAPDEW